MKAWDRGYDSYGTDKENPYEKSDIRHLHWNEGLEAAQRDREKERLYGRPWDDDYE